MVKEAEPGSGGQSARQGAWQGRPCAVSQVEVGHLRTRALERLEGAR